MSESTTDHINGRVAGLRAARGISQAQLAVRCGLSPSIIGDIEGGLRLVSSLELTFISDALDLPEEAFLEDLPLGRYLPARNPEEAALRQSDDEQRAAARRTRLIELGLYPAGAGLRSNRARL